MKILIYLFLFTIVVNNSSAQKNKQISIAFLNTGSAYPFSQFGKLITTVQHPGVELGYSFNWKTKKKHDWYQECKLAYFYHRFVQHAIPLYTDIGYRYKLSQRLTAQVALGAGYLHSIPATAQLKLAPNGGYKNDKGIGRMQALGAVNFGIRYPIKPPVNLFITYQQLVQMPFVKAYVPMLPYNSLMIGVSTFLRSNKN